MLVRSGASYDILWGGLQKLKYYMMEKIIVDVAWCDKNFGGQVEGYSEEQANQVRLYQSYTW